MILSGKQSDLRFTAQDVDDLRQVVNVVTPSKLVDHYLTTYEGGKSNWPVSAVLIRFLSFFWLGSCQE